ncbi:hypothetical protein E8E11_000983 [Didymella keratinophila]|nr:hypothetical protein E8E11_000983 [Didymella keratinophila]
MTDPGIAEKGALVQDSPVSHASSTAEVSFDRAAERRLLRKLDVRIVPVLWILYLVNFIDRANIGNAKIQGMDKELDLIGQRFNICAWVFNLGYLVAGIPLQIAFKKYGPKSLCVMMFAWGICVIGCGLVRRWEELVICRLLEGMSEAAYISGAAYLLGEYYTKGEYLTRYVWFCTAGILAGAINGFLSSLIAKMDGTAGYGAWRWIFIIEGCVTIFADGGHVSDDEISFKKALYYLKDWKVWAGVAMNLGVTENANSLANFQPTILKGLGYTATQAQVHSVPVYVVGAMFSVVFAYMSEYLQRRYYFYILGWAVLASGLIVEIVHPEDPKVRYMGMFFIACGCYLAMPISIIWVSINIGSGYKRAVAIAAIINFGTAGAFVSTNIFMFKESPRFHAGFSTGLGLACMGALAASITWFGCQRENKRKDQQRAGLPDVLEDSMKDLGDEHPDFRFGL